jgi:iron(III)-salmochelin esterase
MKRRGTNIQRRRWGSASNTAQVGAARHALPARMLRGLYLALALTLACREPEADLTSDSFAASAALSAGSASAAATARQKRSGAAAASPVARELSWRFAKGPFGPTEVVISIPEGNPGQRYPVLIALHGRGESLKGSRRGARGWLDDYLLERALERVQRPPLLTRDFEGFVTEDRLRLLNEGLTEHPYAGLIVVCPFLPDVFKGESAFEQTEPLARFLVDVLLPRVYAKTPALGTPASTGIDGVSLGGRAAWFVGLNRPRAFASVAGLQAALDATELGRISEWAVQATTQNPELKLRLLTSDEDHFLGVNQQLSALLARRGVAHELTLVVGTHGYRFNRGPGALEMLLFHDRVLRGRRPL